MKHPIIAILLASTVLAGPALAVPATSEDIAAQTKTLHNDLYAYTNGIIAAIKALPADGAVTGPKLDVLNAKLDVLHNDLAALLAQLRAGTTTVTASTGIVAAAPADPYFPTNSADAKFPSPDDSRMTRNADGTVSGRPYLLNKDGSEFRLVTTSVAPTGYTVNGQPGRNNGGVYNVLIARGGQIYMQLDYGQWQHFEPGMGTVYNATLPDAAGASTVATATIPAVPTLPAPYAIAPGSSGKVLTVGTGKAYATFSAALAASADGDTIDATGVTVHEDIPLIAHAVLIKGGTYDCHDTKLAGGGLGCLVNKVDVTYDGVTVTGAGITEVAAGGTAGIRPAGTSYVTIRNSTLAGNQNGVAGGGFPWVLDMTDTLLDGNGLGDGYTHNMYPADGTVRVTLTRVTSRNPRGGHAVKVRAPMFSCNACTLSADETLVDLPNGTATVATITNSTLTKNTGAANHRLIGYGEEGAKNGTAGVLVTGGTVTGGDSPFVQGTGTVTFDQVTVVGTKPVGQGVTLKGLP